MMLSRIDKKCKKLGKNTKIWTRMTGDLVQEDVQMTTTGQEAQHHLSLRKRKIKTLRITKLLLC